MKKFPLLLFCAILGLSLSMPSIAQNSPKDEELIRNVIAEMTEGFNKHDAKAASQMYTVDADFVTARGDRAKGASD
jgi:ketosteroid isomerase-like protein